MGLTDRILTRAHELGFVRAGVAPAAPLPHGDAFRQWLDDGAHGGMSWMERSRDTRDQPHTLLPNVQSILALAANYRTDTPSDAPGTLAMYARGYDYHRVLEYKLDLLAAFIRAETGADVRTRSAVDRLPLLERDVAYVAGIGWYGKNTCILSRDQGSYLFLAELLVDLDLEHNTADPHPNFCGTCTRCIDLCPTGALTHPNRLDARLCISYLTIEHRGPIPRRLRPLIGQHLFGCDICQDVCPWNSKAPHTTHFAFLGRPEVTSLSADQLLGLTPQEFNARLTLSPVRRPQRHGLLRNAAVVLGNTRDARWVPLLVERLEHEPDPLVRGHVAWALGHIRTRPAVVALERRRHADPDPYVLDEIRDALEHGPDAPAPLAEP